MTFVPVPDTCQVELVYSYVGQRMENVLHYSGNLDGGLPTLEALANNAVTQWAATWKAQQSNALTLVAVKVTDLRTQEAPAVEIAVTTNNAGTRSSSTVPSNVAICIQLKTLNRGRSFRGRVYLPGVTTDQFGGDTVVAGIKTELTDSFDFWDFLDASGEPFGLQVVSRFHNGAARVTGIHTDVTGFVVNPYATSQRRRLPGRGT